MKENVKPGETITLECSTSMPVGAHTFWIQLCSFGQSQLITQDYAKVHNSFNLIKNGKMNCFNLQIINISGSEACLYYDVTSSKTDEKANAFGHNHTKVILTGKTCFLCFGVTREG